VANQILPKDASSAALTLYCLVTKARVCVNTLPRVVMWRNKSYCLESKHNLSITYATAGVKVSRNAVPGPGNLGLERCGCKIILFHKPERTFLGPASYSNIRYSNTIISHSNLIP